VIDPQAKGVSIWIYLFFARDFFSIDSLKLGCLILDHSILIKSNKGNFPILIRVESQALLHILFPIALIF
jgi:hypothetical protein